MNTPQSDDNIIAAFMQEFDAAPDKAPIIARFAERYPQLGRSFFADYASGRSLINESATTDSSSAHRLQPGDMLGDFRIVRRLEIGGQGEIYEARQLHLSERRVAVKVIRQGHVSADARERFLREQAALAKLHQSNILPAIAAGERGEIQYFAMPFVDGANLGHVVNILRSRTQQSSGGSATSSLAQIVKNVSDQNSATLPTASQSASTPQPDLPDSQASPTLTNEYLRSVAASLAEVADALHAAHQANMVHRDVKPANLMIDRETGKCWLIDFGLAGLVGAADVARVSDPCDSGGSSLTDTGSIMGTYPYMSPEQFDGHPEKRSDIWALGVTLYELLTLRRPFPGPTLNDYKEQVHKPVPGRSSQFANVPNDLDAICNKAMQKNANDRYATAKDFADDLRHWLNCEPTLANPPWAGRRVTMWAKRNPGWAGMVGMAFVALVSVIVLVVELQRQKAAAAEAETAATRAKAELTINEERVQARQFETTTFSREYASSRLAGWRDRLWELGKKVAGDVKDPSLRDQMAALLGGLDGRLDSNFKEGAARSVQFRPDGKRLLMGGFRDAPKKKDEDQSQPTRVRDLTTGEIKTSTQAAEGAIGWRGNAPVQLVPPTKERPTLMLWDVDRNSAIEEFAFPASLRPVSPDIQTCLTAICGFIGLPAIQLPSLIGQALSSDGNRAAAMVRGMNGKLATVVWQGGKPDPLATIPVDNIRSAPTAFELSPDGALLALGMENGQVAVWSLTGGPKLVKIFESGRSRITALTFARHRHVADPDRPSHGGVPGWLLAAGDASGQVAVWDLGRLDRVAHMRDSHHEVYGLAFSPDATTLYSTGRRECRCWDVASGRQILRLVLDKRNFVVGVAASSAGNRLALSTIPMFGPDGGVDLFELESGSGIQALRGITGQIRRVTITPDGKWAAAITQDFLVGVWNVATGELVASFDAPRALYSDHDDLRFTNDGQFLIVAGGQEAHRWQLPKQGDLNPRKTETWKLNPAWSNRLAITPDGKILLCRNETKSGKLFPNAVHPTIDPRCVSVYELESGNKLRTIARHFDHAWHVFNILAVPDGSCFVADGVKQRAMNTRVIVAYEGLSDKKLWSIPFPDARNEGNSGIDSSGTELRYWDGEPKAKYKQRFLPYRDTDDTLVPSDENVALSQQFVFKDSQNELGLHLARPSAASDLLALSPDERIPGHNYQMTADGRFVIWGTENGTVNVCDLNRVRELLVAAGFPGW